MESTEGWTPTRFSSGAPVVQRGSTYATWAPVPLRLIVGYGFMEHGFAKLSRGPETFADILQAIGVPGPHVMAWATILTEIISGLAVIMGAFVALVALTDGRDFGGGG